MINLLRNDGMSGKIFISIIIILGGILSDLIIRNVLKPIFYKLSRNIKHKRIKAKTETLFTLLASIIDLTIISLTLLVLLSFWGINISPFLTGAGILGLAVSFGTQSLIKDIISGSFIILENQFNIGDTIQVDKFIGKVKKMTLRLTVLEDEEGNLIYIPNSQIKSVILLKEKNNN